jgi:hypothetical protein
MPALLAALLVAPLTAGVVLEVSPTGPYTQIQAAVTAANDGDLVLVHGGNYTSFTVQAKSLTVVADTGAIVNLQGGVSVLGLAAGQTVCIIGLHAYGDPDYLSLMPSGFLAQGNLGRVRCERCQLSAQLTDTDAARIESSSDVSFVACQMLGGAGYGLGGAGVRAADSTLTFFDSTVHGGNGISFGGLADGGSGGEGLAAGSSTIFSSGSSFIGGNGGSASFVGIITPDPGYGGAGADLASGSLMRHIQSGFVGGLDGDFAASAPPTIGGTFALIPGTLRSMTGANPVRELTPLGFTFHGAPGENVYLLVGLEPGQ